VNNRANLLKGVGEWRRLYVEVIDELAPDAVVELGSGDPAFLQCLPDNVRRLALDANLELQPIYDEAAIPFQVADFDSSGFQLACQPFGVAVCSDVFEHLSYPHRLLRVIRGALSEDGVLLSHVPNEYRWRDTLRIMFNRRNSVYFHSTCEEWNNPHLRRFTDLGYQRFLSQEFTHNLKLTSLGYSRTPRIFAALRLPVPYCTEPGPTYASTNQASMFERLLHIKERLRRQASLDHNSDKC